MLSTEAKYNIRQTVKGNMKVDTLLIIGVDKKLYRLKDTINIEVKNPTNSSYEYALHLQCNQKGKWIFTDLDILNLKRVANLSYKVERQGINKHKLAIKELGYPNDGGTAILINNSVRVRLQCFASNVADSTSTSAISPEFEIKFQKRKGAKYSK